MQKRMMVHSDEKMDEEEYIELSNIFSNLPIKTRDRLWKEFFEKAKPWMNILEFLEMKIKKGEIRINKINSYYFYGRQRN